MSTATLKNLIISVFCLVSAAGVFIFMVYTVEVQGVRLTEQMSNFQTQQANEATYLQLQRITEETKDEREKLSSFFLLKEEDSIDFLNFIESTAPANGVNVTTKGLVLVEDDESKAQWIEVSLSITGSRQRIQSFLQILENIPYVSRLMSVNQEALSTTNWQAEVTMRVNVLAYDQ